jgi:hypothetical protein
MTYAANQSSTYSRLIHIWRVMKYLLLFLKISSQNIIRSGILKMKRYVTRE